MKKLVCGYVLLILSSGANTQKLHLNKFLGVANYTGDLQKKRFTFDQAKLSLGAGLSYEISDKIFMRAELRYAKLTADDKYTSNFAFRNLNFTSRIWDAQLVGEYYFRNLNTHRISPYAFAGMGVFRYNPTTTDSAGNKIYLQPLSTEGQGFYQDRKEYKLTQFSIPFGGGVKFALTDNISTGIEIGMRKLFTDYIDDVSTTYIDENTLFTNKGPVAVDISFRGDELKTGLTYPPEGQQRGSVKYKDWYYFIGFTASFRIVWFGGNGNNSKTACPVNVN